MKIKKLVPYILILFLLFGFVNTAGVASAAGGVCSISVYDDVGDCEEAGGTWYPDPGSSGGGLGSILSKIQELLNMVIPVLVALGVVYFVWGVVQYVIGSDEEAKTKGRDRIIYGIIGLTVIISLWGLVYILADTFDLDSSAAPDLGSLLPS